MLRPRNCVFGTGPAIELRRETGRGIGPWGNQCDNLFLGLLGVCGPVVEEGSWATEVFWAEREIETIVVWFVGLFLLFLNHIHRVYSMYIPNFYLKIIYI